MKNRKQSAVSRRLSGTDTEVVFQNLSNSLSTISSILDNVSNQTNNNTTIIDQVNQTSLATQNLLQNQMNPSNVGSLIARIIDLENNPSGGGGIDPTDPNQPILVWDNFIVQDNGDPSGSVTPYPFFGLPRPTGSQFLSPNAIEIYEADSETGHIGVVLCTSDVIDGYLSMTNSSNIDLVDWASFNRMYLIVKPVTTTTSYKIEFGLFDDLVTPTKGVYVSGTRGANWVPTTKDTGTSTGTTKAFANNWITIKIEKVDATTVSFQFDNDPEITISTNIPGGYLVPGIRAVPDTVTPTSFDFKLDFFSLKIGADPIPVPGGTTIQGTPLEVEVTQAGSVITVGLPDEIAIDQIDFDPTIAAPVLAEGELSWDSDYKTLVMGLVDNTQMQLGQSTYKRVRNQTGSQINKGTPVYVQGSHGQSLIKVEPADASTEATAATTLGIAAMDIPATSDGWVIVFGYLRGINTGSFSSGSDEGKTIWLSTTTGAMTITRPTAPDHGVVLGTLVKSAGGGAGSMFVRVANGQELDELHDVYINKTTIQNGDTIKWNSANNRFEQGPSGGSSNSVSTSIDFGSTYDEYSTEVVVTGQSWVTSGTNVAINPSVVQGHGHTVEDYLLEEIKCYVTSLNPGVGFTIQAYAPNSSFGIFDITVSEL